MTSIPEKSNYTKTPDALLEKLASTSMPGEQWRILMVIIRKTHGWDKKSDWIALSQFSEMTGINRRHVNRSIRGLESKNIITVTKSGDKKHPSYRINTKYMTWKIDQASPKRVTKSGKDIDIKEDNSSNDKEQVSPSPVITVTRSGVLLSPSSGTTIDTITKDTTTTTESATESGRGENLFSENQDQLSGEAPCFGLSPEQLEYVDLKVEADAAAGKIRSTKSAYRHGLIKRARDGLLDTSDRDELQRANQPRKYFNPETDLYADEPGPDKYVEPSFISKWIYEAKIHPHQVMELPFKEWSEAEKEGRINYNRRDCSYTLNFSEPHNEVIAITAFPDGTVKEAVDF